MNTAEWKFIVPQLYKQYPNDDLNLNISVYSTPVLKIGEKQVDATIHLEVIIDVLDAGQVVPVACISVVSFWMISRLNLINIFISLLRLTEFH